MTKLIASGACAALCLLAAGLPAPPAWAEQVNDTTNPLNVNTRLNFRVVYPRFLSFRVGTVGAAVNLLTFSVPAAQVGSGTAITATGGDAGPSGVNVSVLGNNGQVTITPTNNSGAWGSAPALHPTAASTTTRSARRRPFRSFLPRC